MRPNPSYWESIQPMALKAEVPGSLPSVYTDVAIVGAGFCGSWLAYFLLEQNPKLRISIFERDSINLGASLRNAGFLSCGNVSEWLEDSKLFSWDEVLRTLEARIVGIEWIQKCFKSSVRSFPCGSADFDPLNDEKHEMLGRLNGALKSLGREPFFLLKNLSIGGEERKVPFNSFDSEVNPFELLTALHRNLSDKGVSFHRQTEVLEIGNGRLHYSKNGMHGESTYGHAFICTNAFARELIPQSIVQPARGQILVTSPCETRTTRCLGFVRSGYDYFRFIDSRVLVGGGRLAFKTQESTSSLEATAELRDYLTELAVQIIGHRDFKVDYHWAGSMGLREGVHASVSDLEQIKRIDSNTEELAGFGGWGVTLTPYVAQWRAKQFR